MAMVSGSIRQQSVCMSVQLRGTGLNSHVPLPSQHSLIPSYHNNTHHSLVLHSRFHLTVAAPKASAGSYSPTDDDGVSLGTMKLPVNIDLQRFDSLLFQWANSLCQGASLPLSTPLKVDKIPGGARLGFIDIGETEVLVYIDCLVFKPNESSPPVFQATRHGRMKDKVPQGEPRIMRSLMEALQKSVQIASL
ncbi:hypothetical protein MtrunA17_Chr1g0178341 [Medicago truncatula]|uniref:DUF7148 domain-containing protein n=1 Tax=Medicago truncatula TaxID=3880 RepID=I3SI25_MEDTR|nr:uncharacterized protein LOC25483798 [Medicago truncatula]AFK39917.1 unknown [Medicago truncatula]KEH42000.1 hypothetical protein MTR_1g059660 [Medicago truncatula]RHN79529.1 hypothetical protein MtrunA17_Chr1g0178341 [Medicago truncatula]